MSSAEVNGGSVPSRWNSFRRMLDLEKKYKLDRMRASMPAVPAPQTSSRDSGMQAISSSSASGFRGRTMTVPSPPFSIPPTSSSQTLHSTPNPEITKNTLGSSVTVRAEDGNNSDKSSICRSPGWDNRDRKKRKKQKKVKHEAKDTRKREETSAMDIEPQRPQKRLSKAPPVGWGPSKSSITHSESTPTVKTALVNVRDKVGSSGGRNSIHAGQLKLLWRSASPTAGEFQCSDGSEGFIGGVKLYQATDVTVQDSIRKQRMATANPHKSGIAGEFIVEHNGGSSGDVRSGGQESKSPSVEPEKTPYNQNSFATKETRDTNYLQRTSEKYVPLIERTAKRRGSGTARTPDSTTQLPPVSTKYLTATFDILEPSLSTNRLGSRNPPYSNSSEDLSSESPAPNSREASHLANPERQSRPRRGSFRFLRGQRALSKERPSAATQDGSRRSLTKASNTSSKQHLRSKSWSFQNWAKTSSSRLTTAGSNKSNGSKTGHLHQAFPVVSNGIPTPLSQAIDNSAESLRLGPNSTRPAPLQSLTSAAKAAFLRYPYSPQPASVIAQTAKSIQPASIDFLPPRCSSWPAALSGKPEGVMPKALVISTCTGTLQNASSQQVWAGPSNALQSNEYEKSTPNEAVLQGDLRGGQSSNSSSLTISHDDYHSTLDEATNMSTPAESIPQFESGDPKPRQDEGSFSEERTRPRLLSKKSNLITDGTISYVPASIDGYDSRTGMSTQHSCSSNSKSSSRIFSKCTNYQKPKESKLPPSVPNFQDLSFLPALRDQPLGQPARQKGSENSPANYIDPVSRNLVSLKRSLPTPPSYSSTSSTTSSTDLNGVSAQYLQQARQSLPPSSISLASPNTASGSENNNLAKMLVICCHCRYFQDMPSKIYECMTRPDNLVRDPNRGVSGFISTAVRCPWCGHGMSTTCCEGWAAVVVLRERLH